MKNFPRCLSVLAAAAAACVATAAPAQADTTALPSSLQTQLISRLDACLASTSCAQRLTQAIDTCATVPSCKTILNQFLTQNPAILEALFRDPMTSETLVKLGRIEFKT